MVVLQNHHNTFLVKILKIYIHRGSCTVQTVLLKFSKVLHCMVVIILVLRTRYVGQKTNRKRRKAKEVIWISVITTLQHGMNDDNLWTFGRNTLINFAWFLFWQYFATQFLTHHLELTRHLCHSLSRGREMATISYRKKMCTKGRYIKYVLIMKTNGKHLWGFFLQVVWWLIGWYFVR